MRMFFLFLSVIWDDRDKLLVWHLRYHIAALVGAAWLGRSLGQWLAS